MTLDIFIVKEKMYQIIKDKIIFFRLLHWGKTFINEKCLKEKKENLGFYKTRESLKRGGSGSCLGIGTGSVFPVGLAIYQKRRRTGGIFQPSLLYRSTGLRSRSTLSSSITLR